MFFPAQGGSARFRGRYSRQADEISRVEPPLRNTGGAFIEPSAQHPRQMLFSFAFISASSALMLSTYLVPSTFEDGAARSAGLADAATGGVALS